MFPRILCAALLLIAVPIQSQTPTQRYTEAHKRLTAHSESTGFELDNSPDAVAALRDQWSAVADFILDLRQHNPKVSAAELDHSLCLLTAEPYPPEATQVSIDDQCKERQHDPPDVVVLTPNLLLVAAQAGEIGTVFLLGERDGKPAVLWSIADAAPQPNDPHDLIGAWKLERAQTNCRDKGAAHHEPGACGPLYASIGLLPPDGQKRPRFYIDAGYSQDMGATIAAQTSIWRWDGNRATLQWIDWHDTMIDDDSARTSVSWDGLFVFTYKGSFKTMFDCGSCDSRPTQHLIQLQPNGILDLGTRSLTPELDLLDSLFWSIAHGKPTATMAAPSVVQALRLNLRKTFNESHKIEPGWDSIGMIGEHIVQATKSGASVCLQADSLDSTLHFTLRKTLNGGYFVSNLVKDQAEHCAERSTLP